MAHFWHNLKRTLPKLLAVVLIVSTALISLLLYQVYHTPTAKAVTITKKFFFHKYTVTSGTNNAIATSTVAGDLLIVAASGITTTAAITVTDTLGNTFVKIPEVYHTGSSAVGQSCSYALNGKGGADSVKVTSTATDLGVTFVEVSATGGATWSVDKTATSTGATAATTATIPNFSTTGSNDYVFAAWADESEDTQTQAAPFSLINRDTGHFDLQEEDIVSSPLTNQTITVNMANGNSWVMCAAAFTATVAAAGGTAAPVILNNVIFNGPVIINYAPPIIKPSFV